MGAEKGEHEYREVYPDHCVVVINKVSNTGARLQAQASIGKHMQA